MLFPKSYNDIYRQITQNLVNNTPITNFGESSTTRVIIEAVARALSEQYSVLDTQYSNSLLTGASGPALDRIGESYGVFRNKSTIAYSGETNFNFYINPITGLSVANLVTKVNTETGLSLTGIVIKAGTIVKSPINSSSGIEYITTRDVTLLDTPSYTPVQSTGYGVENNIGPNTLTSHNIKTNQFEFYSIADFINCTNSESIDTGQGYENDNDYRARIYNNRLVLVTGNEAAILNAALSVPGVSTCVITPNVEGVGSIGVLVLSTTPTVSQGLLHAVAQAVRVVSSAGVKVIVSSPEYLFIRLKIQLSFYEMTDTNEQQRIMLNVRRAIIDYTNNLSVGGQWVVNEVIQRIMDVSDLISDFKQVLFLSDVYQMQIVVDSTGKATVPIQDNTNKSGINVIWSNLNCTLMNPPQKFVMLSEHLIVC